MPQRFLYSHLFERNPFHGLSPHSAYELLQWGNASRKTHSIEAPEALVLLGSMAQLVLADRKLTFRKHEAFLAVGHRSNHLYIVPRAKNGGPIKTIPKFSHAAWQRIGLLRQTDYLSTKGRQRSEHYYYHKHEEPLPVLWIHPSGVGYVRPSRHQGKPSYAVGREGIVG